MTQHAYPGLLAEATKIVEAIVDPVKECALRWPTFRYELHPKYKKTPGKPRELAGWVVQGKYTDEDGKDYGFATSVGVFFGAEEADARREVAFHLLVKAEQRRLGKAG